MTKEPVITPEEKEFLEQSNAIEGVFDDRSLEQAITAWQFLKEQKILTSGTVLRTHKILMLHQKLLPDEKGYFRTCRVWIGRQEGFPHDRIPAAVDSWLKDVELTIQMPDIKLAEAHTRVNHVTFEKIHPFVDGNGRTGRMFMNWERLKIGLPILIIHAGAEQSSYYSWFK